MERTQSPQVLADGWYWVGLGAFDDPPKRLQEEILELRDGHWQRDLCDLRLVRAIGRRVDQAETWRIGSQPTLSR